MTIYYERTPLDLQETQWLTQHYPNSQLAQIAAESPTRLHGEQRYLLFHELWPHKAHDRHEDCTNDSCTRTRITNKLFLFHSSDKPAIWMKDNLEIR